MVRVQPQSLDPHKFRGGGGIVDHTLRLFNASLVTQDGRRAALPYLAERLPQLNTDDWRVAADGSMETTYHLKPNLTWHDGTPLVADDFAFGWRVWSTPDLGLAASAPIRDVEEVLATDPRTLLVKWKRPYPAANQLGTRDAPFAALPRHILASAYEQGNWEAFTNQPYWTTAYIGLGPYRVQRWELGAFLEGAAFDHHAPGRPKIDRVVVHFMEDESTALAGILTGTVHLVSDAAIRFEQAMTLRDTWTNGKGTVLLSPVQPRFMHVQLRPELANAGLLDVRVRRAVAHAMDRGALNDGLFGGIGVMAETFVTPDVSYFAELERTITRYPFDSRRVEQLMGEAGFQKASEGFFTDGRGRHFGFEHLTEGGGQNAREQAILVDTWRRLGIDVQSAVLPVAQIRDPQARSTFSGLYSTASSSRLAGGEEGLDQWRSTNIGTAAKRWAGGNRGGWSNAEYDRIFDAFSKALDRQERTGFIISMLRILSEDVGIFPLYWNFNVTAHLGTLRGPDSQAIDSLVNWNVHEWELT